MEEFFKWLQTYAMSIISSIAPYIVMIITLYVTNKQFRKSENRQREEFEQRLEEDREYYQKQLLIDSESARILHRPFIWLDKVINVAIESSNDKHDYYVRTVIKLTIKNVGSGIAEGVCVCCENDDKLYHIMETEDTSEGKKEYVYDDYLFTNVLAIGESMSFGISRYVVPSEDYREQMSA